MREEKINQISKGDVLYYRGLNYGIKTFCFDIYIKDGVKYVHTNNGVKRKYDDVINNSCDLYTDIDKINKTLIGVYMGTPVKDE